MPEHPKVNFNKAPCERLYKNEYGASIVLGRDRAGGLAEGFGGYGHTHCASIDIVAGRPAIRSKNGEPALINPTFQPWVDDALDAEIPFASDSARIYLSEKTTLEDNFGLISPNYPRTTSDGGPRSGIGIKADLVAIMGQEGIQLITKPDTHNSWGAEINTIAPINFIAGNDEAEPLEPLVKGDRLVECLKKIFAQLATLESDLTGVITSIIKMNIAAAMHTHPSPFFGTPTALSPTLYEAGINSVVRLGSVSAKSCVSQISNITAAQHVYCNPNGERYINSRHVNTT